MVRCFLRAPLQTSPRRLLLGAAAADASPLRLRLDAAAADGKIDASPLRLRFDAAAADVKAGDWMLDVGGVTAGSWRRGAVAALTMLET